MKIINGEYSLAKIYTDEVEQSALDQIGEKFIVPINMRDGSLICIGRGNKDWNFSAPHGAGRLMSRAEAKRNLSVEEFQKEMEGFIPLQPTLVP